MANNNTKSNNVPAVGTTTVLRPFTITKSTSGIKVSEMRTPLEIIAKYEDGLEVVVGEAVGSGEFMVNVNGTMARCHKNKIAGSEEAAAYLKPVEGKTKQAATEPVKVVAGDTLVLDPMPADPFDALTVSLANIKKAQAFLAKAEQVRIDAVKAAQAKKAQIESLLPTLDVLDEQNVDLAGTEMPE